MTQVVSGVERCRLEFVCPCCWQSMLAFVNSEQLAGCMAWVGFAAVEVDQNEYEMSGRTTAVCVECTEHKTPCEGATA